MSQEIIGIIDKEKRQDLTLIREEVFSQTSMAFTDFGKRVYGLFFVHKQNMEEAIGNGTSAMRIKELTEEAEQRYFEVEKIWGRKIPRDPITSNYLTQQLLTIIREQEERLLPDWLSLTKPLTKR